MYLNTFGGSGLLHLLAGHPRLIAVFGLAATVAMLASPLGPYAHGATARYAAALDASIPPGSTTAILEEANRSAAQRLTSPEQVNRIVVDTLRLCGAPCADVPAAEVLKDPVLRRKVVVLYEANLRAVAQIDAAAARADGTR